MQEEKHLKQFNLTWQLHNKHLFHSVIYSDPVVQNCMPKVLSHIRCGLLSVWLATYITVVVVSRPILSATEMQPKDCTFWHCMIHGDIFRGY